MRQRTHFGDTWRSPWLKQIRFMATPVFALCELAPLTKGIEMNFMGKRLNRRNFVMLTAAASVTTALAACADDTDDADDSDVGDDDVADEPEDAEEDDDDDDEDEEDVEADDSEDDESESEDSDAEDDEADGDVVRFTYGEGGEYTDFNPWSFSATNNHIYNQIFTRLVYRDGSGELITDIADSWELADDAMSVSFQLREDVLWHDGEQCTAEDFVNMFNYTQDEALAEQPPVATIGRLMEPVTGAEAVDEFSLELTFGEPTPYAMDFFDFWFAIRIDDPDDVTFVSTLPIGTGPFVAEEWRPGELLRLSKFEDFYDEGQPAVDELVVRRFESAETVVPNLRAESLDGAFVTQLGELEPLEDDDENWIEISETGGVIYNIMVNTNIAPWDQEEARRALSHTLNREEMVGAAFFGVGTPITSPFYQPESLAYVEELVMAHEFDLERAEELFREAGVEDLSSLELNINVTPNWPQMELYSLMWQQDLAELGITLNVNEVETAQFYEIGGDENLLGNELHPWLNGRTTLDPALFFATQIQYRGGETNRIGYRNEELEELIEEGAVEPDEDRRREIYQRANEITVNSCHMLQLVTNPRIWAFNNSVSDIAIDYIGNLELRNAKLNG